MTTTQEPTDVIDVEDFRLQAREWLAKNGTKRGDADASMMMRPRAEMGSDAEKEHVKISKDFQYKLTEGGFGGIVYPKEYGGQGLTRRHQAVFNAEAAGYILPLGPFAIGHGMCLPTVFTHGTEEQKREHLPNLINGTHIWSQLFSEPGAGSDVAGLQSRAERSGDSWILNGQKVWTTGAHLSDYGCVIVRTDPDQPKHQGLTMFIMDFHAPGVTVRPLRQITGEAHFNEVFFDDVEVPDSFRLDEVGNGWKVAMTMLMNERMSIGGGAAGGGGKRNARGDTGIVRMAQKAGAWDKDEARDRVMQLYVQQRVLAMLREKMSIAARQSVPGPEFSMLKLIGARLSAATTELVTNLMGTETIAWEGKGTSGENAAMNLLGSRSGKIAGGTDEVMLNILGERVLGLPQDPRVDKGIPFRDIKVGTVRT